MVDSDRVIERIAKALGVKSDAAVAEALGLTPQALANARKRGTVPFERIYKLAKDRELSLDDLLLGRDRRPEPIDEDLFLRVANALRESQWGQLVGTGYLEQAVSVYNQVALIQDSDLQESALQASIGLLNEGVKESQYLALLVRDRARIESVIGKEKFAELLEDFSRRAARRDSSPPNDEQA